MAESIEHDILKILLKQGRYPLNELSQMVCPGSSIAKSLIDVMDCMKEQGTLVQKRHCVELTAKGYERASLIFNG